MNVVNEEIRVLRNQIEFLKSHNAEPKRIKELHKGIMAS